MSTAANVQPDSAHRHGVLYALAAYGMWGLIPVYFKWIEQVDPAEIVAHRVIWSLLFLLLLLPFSQRVAALQKLLRQPQQLASLAITAMVVSANWLLFIWAVTQDRILETSLGYFINPLLSVMLGMLFLGERLRSGQWIAVGLVALAVGYQLIIWGTLPWIALLLALSFGTYGLLRKRLNVDPVLGLLVETALLTPMALSYLLWLNWHDRLAFGPSTMEVSVLLAAAGLVTSLPLLAFTAAARRLSLTLMGLLQYLGPSLSFLLAVFIYHEPLDANRFSMFVVIWTALALFTLEGWLWRRQSRRQPSVMHSPEY